MIPNDQSGETDQNSEPFLALSVDRKNPESRLLVGAAFQGKSQPSGAKPLILSSIDGGWTWKTRSILNLKEVASQTYCFSGKDNSFYGAVLVTDGQNQTVSVFHTDDPSADKPMDNISTLSSGSELGDAPFIQARALGTPPATPEEADTRVDNIYVGQNYFGFSGPQKTRTASIRVANDGKTFALSGLEARDTGKAQQDGPFIRPSVANDGVVYVAFLRWTDKEKNGFRGDVVVSRDDKAGAGTAPFRDLLDPSDALPGRMVARNQLFSVSQKLDQQRIIAPLSIAVNPADSSTVYVAWGEYDMNAKAHVLHVKRSTDKGQNWSDDIRKIDSATNPALAVTTKGAVGLLYQQLVEGAPRGARRWETHLQNSPDGGATWTDIPLATFPIDKEPVSEESGPYLGYRSHLLAVGPSFYGIFSAPNIPEQQYFPQGVSFQRSNENGVLLATDGTKVQPSIDPYFFRMGPPNAPALLTLEPNIGTGAIPLRQSWAGIVVPTLVILAGLFALAVSLVQSWRAKQTTVIATETFRKEIHGPPLINYKGYVSLRFTDPTGEPIEQPHNAPESHLIVTFANQAQGSKSEERIVLDGGQDAPQVVFTIVVDSVDFAVSPEHQIVSVPTKGTHEVRFNLRALDSSEKESLFVQVYQKTKLVQVVSHT
jgi:hypothetical protein